RSSDHSSMLFSQLLIDFIFTLIVYGLCQFLNGFGTVKSGKRITRTEYVSQHHFFSLLFGSGQGTNGNKRITVDFVLFEFALDFFGEFVCFIFANPKFEVDTWCDSLELG